ncbi:MAG TPA: gamma-glutamylcyclotransferase [Luteimonas sp.]|nr:gamma-glutamylcyclotransferase [Luteimonas sp.]HRO26596.1 gamma-glutamylcyclotransferase [Luteimonas sp.]HRP72079.1 gamma-glutamylcyclotransferase [Luteimonas sp.]
MTDRLFVYGTLAPGRPNEHVLADVPGTWAPATARGTLVQAGWGAEAGYPAIVPAADGDEVHGFLFSSEELPAHWDRLDAFEGAGYVRVPIPARLADGTIVEACIYALAGPSSYAPGGR